MPNNQFDQKKLDRINELAKKNKAEGLTAAEIEERLNKKVDIISGNNIEPVVYETIQKDEICIYEK